MGGISDFYERLSISKINQYYGSEVICTKGNTGEEDFSIFSTSDGNIIGVGEVKSDVYGAKQSLSQELVKAGGSLQPLPDGTGTWDIRVQPTFNVKKHLTAALQEVILHASTHSTSSWHIEQQTHGGSSTALETMKVQSYSRVSPEGSRAFIHNTVTHGWVPAVVPNLNPWLENLYKRKSVENSIKRLEESKASQRHLFIWIDEASPLDLFLAAKFQPETVPELAPTLPSHITHLWLGLGVFPNKQILAWKFEPEKGWVLTASDYMEI